MDWAIEECCRAPIPDSRLIRRFSSVLGSLTPCQESLPTALNQCKDLRGTYRFLNNERVTYEALLEGHRRATVERAKKYSYLLAVADTTSFNLTTHRAMEGIGPISQYSRGSFLHNVLAVAPDGVPLGILEQKLWVRKDETDTDTSQKHLMEGKESQRWSDMADEVVGIVPATTRMVLVADREGDDYEVYLRAQRKDYDYLIRCRDGKKHRNRRLASGGVLHQAVEQAPRLGQTTIHIDHSGSRAARSATLTLYATRLALQPPHWRKKEELPNLEMSLIRVYEEHPPKGQKPLEWLLLTSLPTTDLQQATQYVQWYAYRWRVERFHYILKSGCHMEDLQLKTVDAFMRALAVYSIVAFRLLWLTYLARKTPTAPCTVAFTDEEWRLLYVKMKKTKAIPRDPPDLRTVVRWIAQLGGFLARKGDGEPGVKTLWRGIRRFDSMIEDWEDLQILFGP